VFIGHFAVGFASKKFARTSLALLLAAPWLRFGRRSFLR
jgi:hypothetical protein